jgi:hypothetical protein
MSLIADPQQWAEHAFGACQLGRAGRAQRLAFSAARIAAHPEKSFPQLFDWNELRAFYRLCNQTTSTLDAIQTPHRQHTLQAMTQQPLVLILHDTTELDFTSHKALQGTGPIGDHRGQGFLQHNSLAVSPRPRRLLGLAHQQWHVRKPAPARETGRARKQRPRESQLWTKGITATGRPPEGCTWVDVGDRGADDYEAMAVALGCGHHFLFRITQDRLVFTRAECASDEQVYLRRYARTLPGQGTDLVEIPGRGGRPPRTAIVSLAAAPVWVPAPKGTPKRKSRPILACWLVRVWEPDPPANVKEPLEWILLGSLPAATPEQIKERRDWYCCRPLVEMYHDVEKNGCREEDRRFETAEGMQACVATLAVVAVRVLQLRLAAQEQPAGPAEQVATKQEAEVLTRQLGQPIQTVRQFVPGVARLGGFLGRKGDGEPGVRALWRGYQRLQDMLVGFQLHQGSPDSERHDYSPPDFWDSG